MRGSSADNRAYGRKRRGYWLFLAVPLAWLLLALGPLRMLAVRPVHWTCALKSRGNDVMMDFGRFAIIFEDILTAPTGNETWTRSGTLSWRGRTHSRGNIVASDLFYTKTSGGGVTDFTVAGHRFTIRDSGPALILGPRVYDVSGSRRVFIVDKSGKARVR